MKAFKQFVSDIDSWTGVALGLIAIGIAIVIRPWTQYRFINDPLQLIQPILNLRFGFLFFAWGQILNHLLFIISISSIALLYANLQRRPSADVALKVVTIALLVAFAEETTPNQIDLCEREIAEHTNVAGVVLNKCRFPVEDDGYGYYGY